MVYLKGNLSEATAQLVFQQIKIKNAARVSFNLETDVNYVYGGICGCALLIAVLVTICCCCCESRAQTRIAPQVSQQSLRRRKFNSRTDEEKCNQLLGYGKLSIEQSDYSYDDDSSERGSSIDMNKSIVKDDHRKKKEGTDDISTSNRKLKKEGNIDISKKKLKEGNIDTSKKKFKKEGSIGLSKKKRDDHRKKKE